MASPITPEVCARTGRLMTEWFEYPEYDDEDLRKLAYKEYGLTEEEGDAQYYFKVGHADELSEKLHKFVVARKSRKWKNNMSKQEVAMRMNEASKMVDPSNYKFLDNDVRERTGLETNPLWMMECLVRSGLLSPKEQIAALKTLAEYTHSKSPSINHNTTTHMNPEDWLVELAKGEYQVLGVHKPLPAPRQPIELGSGAQAVRNFEVKSVEIAEVVNRGSKELDAMMADFDDWTEDEDPDKG